MDDQQRPYKYLPKPLFEERMKILIPNNEDYEEFTKTIHTQPLNYIRCNTIKISPQNLLTRLQKKWIIEQPFPDYNEIMLIKSNLLPGELGNSIEHILGYYYIQEVCSMMSVIALDPNPGDFVLDLFASPGSKTTQMASKMNNEGTIIANDLKIGRISILVSNLEKCGVTNTIVTRKDAIALCATLSKSNFKFDKILADVPCSGEGTIRSSPKTFIMWNPKVINNLSKMQKKFIAFAFRCLKVGGSLVYSTCTHAPEENEEVLDFALKNFPVKVESISLPLKCRQGITKWNNESFSKEVEKSCRIYPHDNNSEGFFVSKLTLMEELK